MKLLHFKDLWKASFLLVVGGYAYCVTTNTFLDTLLSFSFDSLRPIVVGTGFCAIAVLYIGLFHAATRFIDGVLLLATCVIASWLACLIIQEPESSIKGIGDGVLFGVISGFAVLVVSSSWCLKPGVGGKRKRLVLRSGIVAICCLLIFTAGGWWESKLTDHDYLFTRLLYSVSFGIVFVGAWLSVGPLALMTVIRKTETEVTRPSKMFSSETERDAPLSCAVREGGAQ